MCHGIICDQYERLKRRTANIQAIMSSLLKSFVYRVSKSGVPIACTNILSYNCLKQIKYISTHYSNLYLTVSDMRNI